MAKKKKSSSKKLSKLTLFLSLVFAAVVFGFMFTQAVVTKDSDGNVVNEYAGHVIAFGKTLGSVDWGTLVKGDSSINFSFGLTFAYLAPLVFVLVAVLVGLAVKKSNLLKALLGFVAFSAFVAALVLVIYAPTLATVTTKATSIIGSGSSTSKLVDSGYILGWGSYIVIVGAGLGALTSLGYVASKILK